MRLRRRDLLRLGALAPMAGMLGCGDASPEPEAFDDGWRRGDLAHLLPTASHDAFRIKCSFHRPLAEAPWLHVGEARFQGTRQDRAGRFWAFSATGLQPDHTHRLELRAAGGRSLCEAWPLRTLPHPTASPGRMRLASFTCAGGVDFPVLPGDIHPFKPASYRRRALANVLAASPAFVIANGDHVYWDFRAWTSEESGLGTRCFGELLEWRYGAFDRSQSPRYARNEAVLTAVGDDQISGVYGVAFRSTPIFFVTDDHDYFENDDATPDRVTFPPEPFHRALRDALQRLYLPEFIAGPSLPEDLPGVFTAPVGRSEGLRLSTHFGEVRFGRLAAVLLYDCGGFLTLGKTAGLVPSEVEAWLRARTADEDTLHLVHAPSHPVGWTAGKWREWYPDWLVSTGSFVAPVGKGDDGTKYLWQQGWWQQHQRLLAALGAQRRRRALMVSGDLHALGMCEIRRSGELDLAANPVVSVLSGPIGTGDFGWPTRARGVAPDTPAGLDVVPRLGLEERNGYTLVDLEGHRCEVRLERFPEGLVRGEAMAPARTHRSRIAPMA